MNRFIKNKWILIAWMVIILVIPVYFVLNFLIGKYQGENCSKLLIGIEKEYQNNTTINTENNNSDYENFVIITDKQCPFISTAMTGECLDRLISKKETELKNLITELRNDATTIKERVMKESGNNFTEIDSFLKYLSMHEKSWDNYSNSFCGIKNSQIGGSAIVEESRKCRLFQIEQFIQLLEDQKSWIM